MFRRIFSKKAKVQGYRINVLDGGIWVTVHTCEETDEVMKFIEENLHAGAGELMVARRSLETIGEAAFTILLTGKIVCINKG